MDGWREGGRERGRIKGDREVEKWKHEQEGEVITFP